jgi:hypothetical protein
MVWLDMIFTLSDMSLSAADKQGWLRGIQLAQDSGITAPPTHQQQQQLMQDFFRTADN